MDDIIKANSSIISDKIISYHPYPNHNDSISNITNTTNSSSNTTTTDDDTHDNIMTLWLGMYEAILQEPTSDNEKVFREYVR